MPAAGSAAVAIILPLVCAQLGRQPGAGWALRDVLGWLALGGGVLGGVAAVVLGSRGWGRPGGSRPGSVVAVLAGLLAIPVSFACAIVAGGPIR
ncbi:MAG TPA: hypothetical protein VIF09_11695 [Polyangiaceae bacterium]